MHNIVFLLENVKQKRRILAIGYILRNQREFQLQMNDETGRWWKLAKNEIEGRLEFQRVRKEKKEEEKKKVFENVDSSMQSARSERASRESNETIVPTSPICETKNIERQNLCCNPTLLPLPFIPRSITPSKKKLSHLSLGESYPVRSKNA